MGALDQALAVAPDDAEARAAMSRLREKIAQQERDREIERRVAGLVGDGRGLLREGAYSQASSRFRQALSLRPSPRIQGLLDEAQRGLRAEIESVDERRAVIAGGLEDVRRLESAGDPAAALERLQAVLAVDPDNEEAQQIQGRLVGKREEEAATSARQETIAGLLREAREHFEAGSAERSLAAANRVLALEPGNAEALRHVARAYARVSQRLLGTGPRQNIPPAVRFVDLREEGDDGTRVQTIRTPEFRLSGVVIDDSPVDVDFFAGEQRLDAGRALSAQPLGDSYITEFSLQSRLRPGLSTFRLVATDSENLSSSSEYAVLYARPFYRSPWFYALVLAGAVGVGGALVWRRSRRRELLRRRRFNPYVAGAPIRQDGMFFGRRELVDRILDTIHNNSLLLYGERRIGKTSIQHQLGQRLKELDDPDYQFFPVYIDLQGTPEDRFFASMAEEIFHELAPLLDGLRPAQDLGGEYDYRDFIRDLHAVLRVLKKRTPRGVRLVLLIDEVDELNDYDPRINQKLRSLFMKSFAENLVAVVSGVEIRKQWGREGSPWYNFFEELEVRPLATPDARRLVEEPIRGMFTLEEGVADRVVELTDGKPYLIQKCCIALVTRMHEAHRRKLRAVNRGLLLLCDEVEELINLGRKDPSLLRKLRRVMQGHEDIRSVLASTIRLWDLREQKEDTSPFLHGFTPPVYIERLTDEEARSLVQQSHLPPEERPRFPEGAIEAIRERCDNHPYLIQLVSKRCLEAGDLDATASSVWASSGGTTTAASSWPTTSTGSGCRRCPPPLQEGRRPPPRPMGGAG